MRYVFPCRNLTDNWRIKPSLEDQHPSKFEQLEISIIK
jgi:hypothetical protein